MEAQSKGMNNSNPNKRVASMTNSHGRHNPLNNININISQQNLNHLNQKQSLNQLNQQTLNLRRANAAAAQRLQNQRLSQLKSARQKVGLPRRQHPPPPPIILQKLPKLKKTKLKLVKPKRKYDVIYPYGVEGNKI